MHCTLMKCVGAIPFMNLMWQCALDKITYSEITTEKLSSPECL